MLEGSAFHAKTSNSGLLWCLDEGWSCYCTSCIHELFWWAWGQQTWSLMLRSGLVRPVTFSNKSGCYEEYTSAAKRHKGVSS